MLPKEKEMEVLEVYDLTKSYRSAAQLCEVDHHTVARLVAARAVGAELKGDPAVRSKMACAYADKIVDGQQQGPEDGLRCPFTCPFDHPTAQEARLLRNRKGLDENET